MKYRKIIQNVFVFMWICFELIGCSPMNSPEESDPMESLNRLFIDENYPSEWYWLLSPNGEWLVQGPFLHQDPLRIISTGADQGKLQMDANEEVGWAQSVDSWSPDSTKLAVLGLERPGKCAYDRIILYRLTEDRQLKRFIYRFPEEEVNCMGTAWAPDSSQIAVSTGNKLYILGDQAQLIQKISFEEKIGYFVWAKKSIYGFKRSKDHSILWRIDPKALEKDPETLLSKTEGLGILGIDPTEEKILLGVDKDNDDSDYTYTFWVFDLKTQKIIQELPFAVHAVYYLSNSIDPPVVGLKIDDKEEQKPRLFIYNWENQKMTDMGRIQFFIGWRSNVNGFLVVKEKEDQYWLELIKP